MSCQVFITSEVWNLSGFMVFHYPAHLTFLTLKNTILWDVILCSLVKVYQCVVKTSVNLYQTTWYQILEHGSGKTIDAGAIVEIGFAQGP
jgi:hypothetical protein